MDIVGLYLPVKDIESNKIIAKSRITRTFVIENMAGSAIQTSIGSASVIVLGFGEIEDIINNQSVYENLPILNKGETNGTN